MDAEFMKLVEEKTTDLAEQAWKNLEAQYEGDAPGMHHMNDLEHRVWFEMMAAKDPNWVMALQYVPGGNAEVSRYLKTVQKHEAMRYG